MTARLGDAVGPPEPDELLVVVGPTATGKTDLAIELAERFGGEIVSADSVQIYRHFDVGSGKPTAEERARAPHHLVDARDPLDSMDAQQYADLAQIALDEIRARGRAPIACGGSFLWVRALVLGLAPAPRADAALRAEHARIAEEQGRAALHAELARVDPESAARLAPNDFIRVSRALEVFVTTGQTMTEWHRAHGFRIARHRARMIGRSWSPAELDARIEARAKQWLAEGWREEVERLVEMGYGSARAMGSVGYREVLAHVRGALSAAELLPAIVRSTRIFVRRQRTWLRDQPVTWLA